MVNVWTNLIVIIIVQYIHVSNHHVYTLNLHNVLCQLYLSKAGKNLKIFKYKRKILGKRYSRVYEVQMWDTVVCVQETMKSKGWQENKICKVVNRREDWKSGLRWDYDGQVKVYILFTPYQFPENVQLHLEFSILCPIGFLIPNQNP